MDAHVDAEMVDITTSPSCHSRTTSDCSSSSGPSVPSLGGGPPDDDASASSVLSSASSVRPSRSAPADPYADVRARLDALASADRRAARDPCAPLRVHPDITQFAALTTYFGYFVLLLYGHIRDFFGLTLRVGTSRYLRVLPPRGYGLLLAGNEYFYTSRVYHRIHDCFNRPIASAPGVHIEILERMSHDGNKTMTVVGPTPPCPSYGAGRFYSTALDGTAAITRRCLNLGSYNYLGFADEWSTTCGAQVLSRLRDHPVSYSSAPTEAGTTALHAQLERTVARFVGKEDAVVLSMGFGTNFTVLPALVGPGDLLLSDRLNHTSIVAGARASGATIRTFRHNDAAHLERLLRAAVLAGRDGGDKKKAVPWRKIFVIIEGIYSMEGEICDLAAIVPVCQKYGAYIYLDEAHSIGALGRTGRGCCEYCGVDPGAIDVMMGTFTKSYGAMGGYVAADRHVVRHLREQAAGSSRHGSMSPIVCAQVLTALQIIMGEDGTDVGYRKLGALRDNSNYFRMRLTDMGLHVLGNYDSPVIPIMLYNTTKIPAFSRECFKRGLAVVVVGFPAVPVFGSRARLCLSAAHRREDLDRALVEIEEVAELLKLRYDRSTYG